MQDIENDMDDLFRRAAEEYPLNAGQGDWESVEKRISVTSTPVAIARPAKKKNNKIFLLLLSVVFFSLAGLLISQQGSENNAIVKSRDQPGHQSLQNSNPVVNSKPIDNMATARLERKEKSVAGNEMTTPPARKFLNKVNERSDGDVHADIKRNVVAKKNAALSAVNVDGHLETNMTVDLKNEFSNLQSSKEYSSIVNDSLQSAEKIDKKKKDSKDDNSLKNENSKAASKKKETRRIGFYAGPTAGIDFSKVKSTSFKEPGFGLGILVGYKMKSFFLETGASLENKYYLSQGSSFNDADANMPTGMVIENLESRSKILEIPLKAGYYFYKKKKTKLFITGGTSLYIMTNEKNNYNVTMNGSPQKMTGLYEKNNLKIPAVASISAGWEH
ncbi:MAG: outer membrane beta-barrel protein, partial [Ginsengibacter sp.]